jgi:hypothetical protein
VQPATHPESRHQEKLSRLQREIPIKAAYSYLSASIGFSHDAFKKLGGLREPVRQGTQVIA